MNRHDTAEDLAKRLVDFFYDFDTYEFYDQSKGYEQDIEDVKSTLLQGKGGAILEYLNNCKDELEDFNEMSGTVIYLTGRVKDFIKEANQLD